MAKANKKPTLVFLHGLGLDGKAYQHGLEKLEDHYNIYAPDMMRARGSAPCIEEFAQYVAKKIADLELETPLYIAGHSMGGGVALRVAYDHPELVKGLVLINSIGTRIGASWPQLIYASLTTTWPGVHEVGQVTETIVRNAITHPHTLAALVAHKVKAVDLEKEILAVKGTPVIVVHSSGDKVIDYAHSEQLAEMLTSPLRVIPGNHGWMFHNWNAFASTLESSLTELGGPSSRPSASKQRSSRSRVSAATPRRARVATA